MRALLGIQDVPFRTLHETFTYFFLSTQLSVEVSCLGFS